MNNQQIIFDLLHENLLNLVASCALASDALVDLDWSSLPGSFHRRCSRRLQREKSHRQHKSREQIKRRLLLTYDMLPIDRKNRTERTMYESPERKLITFYKLLHRICFTLFYSKVQHIEIYIGNLLLKPPFVNFPTIKIIFIMIS